jgi:tetratricopeptide (TPR) repeat protein
MAASTFSAQAHFRLGEIKYRITRDFDGALESFQSARSLTSDNNLIRKSTVRIGDVLVAKGDLKGALDFFNHQIESAQTDKDEKIYLLKKCQVSFFAGEMDTTLYLLRNLIGLLDITDEYLNDVLELKGFVEENYVRASEEGKNAFKTYLQGEYFLRQHKLSEAQLFFDKVTRDYPESFIADDAAFRRAKIHVLLGDFDSAVSGILGLLESPIGDRAATLLGEIYDYHLNDSHEAMQWYLTVLEQHQESMLAEPVRHRIRELSNEMEMN